MYVTNSLWHIETASGLVYEGRSLADFSMESSWEKQTDTAKLTLPGNAYIDKQPVDKGIGSLFHGGDKVSISLGYDGNLEEVFQGYVAAVKPNTRVTLELEDAMYLFKRTSAPNVALRNATVKSVVDLLVAEVNKQYPSANIKANYVGTQQIGAFRMSRVTCSEVLNVLRKSYGVQAFFRGGSTLYTGLAYTRTEAGYSKTVEVNLQRGIPVDGNNLTWQDKEDIKIEVDATCFKPDNTTLKLTAGAKGGEKRTYLVYGNLSESQLRKQAEEAADTYRYSGYSGTITLFGLPFAKQGDKLALTDPRLSDRSGTYLIKSVKRSFGMGGYRQTIELDRKV